MESFFEILRNATLVASIDTQSHAVTIAPGAPTREGTLIFSEEDRIVFRLSPDRPESQHRIYIGDVPLSDVCGDPRDADGRSYGDFRAWADMPAFESARGHTEVRLESAPTDRDETGWRTRVAIGAYVLPTKLGDKRYQAMSDQVQELSRSLVIDLYGKSRRSIDLDAYRDGRRLLAPHQELKSIARTAVILATVIQEIERSPLSTTTRMMTPRRISHRMRITQGELNRMRPDALQEARSRPVMAWVADLRETHDVPEHQVLLAFLHLLQKRTRYCARAARSQRGSIEQQRAMRDIAIRSGPTIYETEDLPRIRRLSTIVERAGTLDGDLETLCLGRLFEDVQPDLGAIRGGTFTRGTAYAAALAVIRDYLLKSAVWTEIGADEEVIKLTHRLFEQWCFIKLVDAFRACGLELAEWKDEIRHHLQDQFVLDFDRGTEFIGRLDGNRRLRFRYEPWIRNEANARKLGESLCRGGQQGDVAWSPDVVIEHQIMKDGAWATTYGIVMDAKYSRAVRDHHWSATLKYEQIRNTETPARPIIKQLWLMLPQPGALIESEDPAVSFGLSGPSCPPDERSRFVLGVDPLADGTNGSRDVFAVLAQGTLNYIGQLA